MGRRPYISSSPCIRASALLNAIGHRLLIRIVVCTILLSAPTTASSSDQEQKQSAAPRITGEQLELLRLRVRESELFDTNRPIWTTVNWLEDARIAVHIRIDGMQDPERYEPISQRLQELIQAELLTGQRFDLYLIGSEGVQACSP